MSINDDIDQIVNELWTANVLLASGTTDPKAYLDKATSLSPYTESFYVRQTAIELRNKATRLRNALHHSHEELEELEENDVGANDPHYESIFETVCDAAKASRHDKDYAIRQLRPYADECAGVKSIVEKL